ncbi:DUF3465 domain-containing protein [Gilvimarinus algae]|uniref:DUF3465 domain-containing protein n=1 Tax=Gilvimarinus algae TaxID=3058037 RepID=A0ABT8TDL2_9GAMM|nr:DUF3465 domain-containing protein [Gilvimarinus sp. SDUM040014]MDO3382199.1 DUF3465 domain-containing protein [Gilvimarinus sp. SDUM040014]
MWRSLLIFLVTLLAIGCAPEPGVGPTASADASVRKLQHAYEHRQSDLQVEGQGVVSRILPDDTKGSKHQRFILMLSSGQTLLVAHNIDLAPRLEGLSEGDVVGFFGEYEWNDKGGVIHWTHHDPAGRHVDGWLRYRERRYQ